MPTPTPTPTATIDDFTKLDIRVGRVLTAEPLKGARNPAFALTIDLGPDLGTKNSSAQITDAYEPANLTNRLVLCITNLPPRRIAGFNSEVLTLGVYTTAGVALITPDDHAPLTPSPGDKLG